MSYILDALKKAEQKRHLGAKVPTLATVHRTEAPPPAGRRVWPWIAAGLILVNAGALIWLLRPTPTVFTAGRASEPPSPAPSVLPAAPAQPAMARPVEPAAPAARPDKPDAGAAAPTAPEKREARARPAETRTAAPALPAPPRAERQKPRQADAPGTPPPAITKQPATAVPPPAAPAPAKVATTAEKSVIQATARGPAKPPEPGAPSAPASSSTPAPAPDIPKMKLQMLVYSEIPSERLVFIDDHKYLEGSSIDGKLVVESITPEGAVLSYQGKRFLLRQ